MPRRPLDYLPELLIVFTAMVMFLWLLSQPIPN